MIALSCNTLLIFSFTFLILIFVSWTQNETTKIGVRGKDAHISPREIQARDLALEAEEARAPDGARLIRSRL